MVGLQQYDKTVDGDEVKIVYLECVVLPNGEIMRNGESLGFIGEENEPKGVFIKEEAE